MHDLLVRFKKKSDGAAALSCLRSDGTTTWQRQDGQLGRFFPPHDLTHLAVESVLGIDRGFYGLIAGGWDISFFADPNGRGPNLPHDALVAELIVGYLDLELRIGTSESAEDYNARMASYFADRTLPPPSLTLTDELLAQIRAARKEYFALWNALPAGETLELTFNRRGDRTVQAATRGHKIGART